MWRKQQCVERREPVPLVCDWGVAAERALGRPSRGGHPWKHGREVKPERQTTIYSAQPIREGLRLPRTA